jgi:uncharacterized protein YbjT (DUF2867 family)
MTPDQPKRILVIGGTGAQGFAVVRALLSASPAFKIRVLSRNPDAPNTVAAFKDLDVEFAKGSFMDFDAMRFALEGCYGVFVNTDGPSDSVDGDCRYVMVGC